MKNLNKRDFLIVLFLVIAAPLGYTLKLLYKNYNIKENSAQYSIQISVKGIMNTKADTYIAIFGVSQTDETIETCHELINKRIKDF